MTGLGIFYMDWISFRWMPSGWCQCYFLKLDGVDISRERTYLILPMTALF